MKRKNLLVSKVGFCLLLGIALHAKQAISETITFYHNDLLGSPVAESDVHGNIKWRQDYKPYGEKLNKSSEVDVNEMWFTGKQHDDDIGLTYMNARFYDPSIGRFMSMDPLPFTDSNSQSFGPYIYANNNPYKYTDPNGESPFSVLAKYFAKLQVKVAMRKFGEKNIKNRLKRYMTKKQMKEFTKDLEDILATLDDPWYETVIEVVPVAGDIYGAGKMGLKVKKAYGMLQDLENKWVGKIYNSLSGEAKKKFKRNMRAAGVRDAKKDQNVRRNSGKDGHHKESVKKNPEKMSDPRNIEMMDKADHIEWHKINGYH